MCGIYHIGRELESGVESLMRMVNRERRKDTAMGRKRDSDQEKADWQQADLRESIDWLQRDFVQDRDVRPTDLAPVLSGKEDGVILRSVRWGLPGFQKGQVIFNARSETALEKSTFRDGVLHDRIVIPAVSFYEWNKRKEKNTFTRTDGKVIYMAGFCRGTGEEERFAILTTAANESMAPIHDRMPLILEESEVEPWLYREDWTESILRKVPGALSRKAEYEQLSFF